MNAFHGALEKKQELFSKFKNTEYTKNLQNILSKMLEYEECDRYDIM